MPAPHGPAAEVATRIGLGTIKTASQLILDPAPPEWIAAAGSLVEDGLFWPVDNGRLWRGMDRVGRKARLARRGRTRHKGIDIGAQEGSPIKAVKSGLVAYSDNGVRGYGNLLITLHPDGSVAFYAHCQATYVFAGQTITQGQVIAEVGDTGAARGPHLHFEYRESGRLRDPLPLFIDRPDR